MSKKHTKLNRSTIRRVLALIHPYAGSVFLTLTLAVITVFTTLLAPVISGKAVDLILGPGQVDFAGLAKLAVAMGITILCTAVAQWLMNVVNNRITFQVVRDIRIKAFEQLEILPLKYMDAHRPGDAISRITTDVEQFSDGLLMGFTQLFTGVLTILGTLGVMISIDWRIALVVVARLREPCRGTLRAHQSGLAEMRRPGSFLLLPDQSLHPLCQCAGLRRRRRAGCLCRHCGQPDGRRTFGIPQLRQSVHQTVQRHLRCHDRIAERTGLCAAGF